MPRIRPYRPGDEAALASICLRTADAGGDATGLLEDDELWAHLFLLPYLEHDPGLAFVVEADTGEPAGYVVAAADSEAFERWFRDRWWPRFAARWPAPAPARQSEQDRLLRHAYDRDGEPGAFAAEFPAHLHIDLLPQLQGQGFGRRLIETLKEALRAQGVAGLHAVPLADNHAAVSFYERLGFTELGREPRVITFGLEL